MTTHPDGDHEFEDEFGHDQHDDERAIPTIVKVALLIAVALLSVWVGWLLR